ncbi:otospiralin isoform X3 [Narcine bancroftii]|uniref:otospiralin isoform X3 n=1 Tax=Narcine bancroftii TaxID=1343680 RepID=UPI003832158E
MCAATQPPPRTRYWEHILVLKLNLKVKVFLFRDHLNPDQKFKMKWLFCIGLFLFFTLSILTDANVIRQSDDHHVEKRSPPYWPYSTSDFWRYVEYFRSIGDYDRIQQLAYIFYAHFPLGNSMGYDTPEQQEIQTEIAKEAHE